MVIAEIIMHALKVGPLVSQNKAMDGIKNATRFHNLGNWPFNDWSMLGPGEVGGLGQLEENNATHAQHLASWFRCARQEVGAHLNGRLSTL